MKARAIVAAVLALAALALCAAPAAGQVPEKMNYQVRLTDDADQPLANETHGVSFRVHNVASGGPILWQENHNLTTDSNGVVSVVLGSINPLTIGFDVPLWLEIRIEDEILDPRRELLSTPYALYARTTQNVAYATAAGTADTAAQALNSDNLGGTAAADFVLDSDLVTFGTDYVLKVDLATVGTINDTTNPADWTKLKGVPADFADGSDDTGPGDGHSLDASDGDPANVVAVDADGVVTIGSASLDASLVLYGEDGPRVAIMNLGDYSDYGGTINLNPSAGGSAHTQLQPDVDGGAGFFYVDSQAAGGFIVDGNDESDGSPVVQIVGAGSTVEFDVGETGDASVQLPSGAVNSTETLDEPGVGCYYTGAGTQIIPTYAPVVSQSIVAPGPGYAFVIATGQANCTHDTTAVSRLFFGVSPDSTVLAEGLDQEIQLEETVPGGAYKFAFAPAAVFPVGSAGTHTFYLTASAAGTWYIYDVALSVLYFPTAYGSVTGSVKAASAQSDADAVSASSGVEVRKAQSEAANDARIERELAEMEARIAEIREGMTDRNRP
ncbi:MAG: hypothetical protein ABIG03_02415 [Candidatus Eisenbacteria bacterium]